MPRKPRLVIPGYPHHIILRGNNKNAVFYNDSDRIFFLNCLKDAKKKTESKIYAYCLMTNHIHLLVNPSSEDGLSNMIQSIGSRYVQNINHKYRRTGTLWEGRFKSSVVNNDRYLLACSRYIELNPLRANIVQKLEDYPWSSYLFKTGRKFDALLDEDPIYAGLGTTREERQKNYKKWFLANIPEDEIDLIRKAIQKEGILGDKNFIQDVAKIVGRNDFLNHRGRPKKTL